jgi:hypothetical protein
VIEPQGGQDDSDGSRKWWTSLSGVGRGSSSPLTLSPLRALGSKW